MSDYIDIIPIYESHYIHDLINGDYSFDSDMVFQPSVKSLVELKIVLMKSRNSVVLACANNDNISDIVELSEYLEEKNVPAVVLSDDMTLNYRLMRLGGVFAVVDYKHSNDINEQKMLLAKIKVKISDACAIKSVIAKRPKINNNNKGNNIKSIVKNNYIEPKKSIINSKNKINSYFSFDDDLKGSELIKKITESEKVEKVEKIPFVANNSVVDKLIVVGASTGGTEALIEVLKKLPADMPPMLVVQHMPPVFTKMYAERCNYFCKMRVQEAKDGVIVENGNVYIAPGDYHMRLERNGGRYFLSCKKGAKVNGVCPSVDVLFDSVVKIMPKKTIGVILTGMGNDGAEGLLKLKKKGAFTIGQNEKTCVVYGMPKEAYNLGAVDVQADIEEIAKIILDNL